MKLSQLRILYDEFNGNRDQVGMAISSINLGYVTVESIQDVDYFYNDGRYYSNDEYVETADGYVIPMYDAFYCPGFDQWCHRDESVIVHEYRTETRYSESWAERNSDLSYFEGEYYDSDGLDYCGLEYAEDTGSIHWRDDLYYHEDRGYFTYPEESYVRGYHNGSYKTMTFDGKSKYKIGYEIEKEDETVRNSIDIDDFEDQTGHYWRKESDGSLDCDCGYELISPTFEFNIDKIFEHIEGNPLLVSHINAEKSTCCGGHIHLSEKGLSGDQLFEKVRGYTPLLYALYYGRVDKTYCKGKCNEDLKNENEKYQAIKIHHDRIEFRIISAVPNVSTLKWRSKLLMMILQNPTNDVIKAYYNVDTKFTKLLKQTYSDDRLSELKDRFIKFTRQFEGLDINK
jgi:hypothetical protein